MSDHKHITFITSVERPSPVFNVGKNYRMEYCNLADVNAILQEMRTDAEGRGEIVVGQSYLDKHYFKFLESDDEVMAERARRGTPNKTYEFHFYCNDCGELYPTNNEFRCLCNKCACEIGEPEETDENPYPGMLKS